MELTAGFGRTIISPPKGIYLIGYGDRTWGNKGVYDELTASAIALEIGKNRVIILACDLLAINEFTLNRVKERVNENIIVCCSHTHSGPIVYSHKFSGWKRKKYVNFLVDQLVAAISMATENLVPASLHWGEEHADIAVNRRERKDDAEIQIGTNQNRLVDKSIGILQVRSKDGKPFANIVNFACHNVVLGPRNRLVSADWAGEMRRSVEGATGIPCLFIQGAAADINPNYDWGDDDLQAVIMLGNRVAFSVLKGLKNLRPIDQGSVLFMQTNLWMQLETKADSNKPPKTYRKKLSEKIRIPSFLIDTLLNIRYPWKTQIRNQQGFWSIPLPITLLKIGDFYWIGLGAEVFCEIGLRLKSLINSSHVIFSSLTNGCIGYLATEDEHALGGYEIDLAPFFYRLPGRLKSTSADLVINKTMELINQMSEQAEQ